jgi:hypothetical protein
VEEKILKHHGMKKQRKQGLPLFPLNSLALRLFHGYTLGQISGFINIRASENGHIIREYLQRYYRYHGSQDMIYIGQQDLLIAFLT